jgi:NADH-quinone oxidoreductase subunit J
MNLDVTTGLFWALAGLSGLGAIAVITTKDVTRLALGLGAFLLAVAGFFALFGLGFLALAQLFVYVGGVLILVLFAIMLVHRSTPGAPELESRHDSLAAVACLGIFGFAVIGLGPVAPELGATSATAVDDLGAILLGPMLPHFELVGVLLLGALVAVVAVSGGDRE